MQILRWMQACARATALLCYGSHACMHVIVMFVVPKTVSSDSPSEGLTYCGLQAPTAYVRSRQYTTRLRPAAHLLISSLP